METIFYVERKTYYTDGFGKEHQTHDDGETPILYRTKDGAIRRAMNMKKYWTENGDYLVTKATEKDPAAHGGCFYEIRLQHENSSPRCVIRIYEIQFADAYELID